MLIFCSNEDHLVLLRLFIHLINDVPWPYFIAPPPPHRPGDTVFTAFSQVIITASSGHKLYAASTVPPLFGFIIYKRI